MDGLVAAASRSASALSTSPLTIRPPGPLPSSRLISTELARASFFATGEMMIRALSEGPAERGDTSGLVGVGDGVSGCKRASSSRSWASNPICSNTGTVTPVSTSRLK